MKTKKRNVREKKKRKQENMSERREDSPINQS